jgi:DNA ligase-1
MTKSVVEILEEIESSSGRKEKERLLQEHQKNDLLRDAIRMGIDPYLNYGVIKFKRPAPNKSPSKTNDELLTQFLVELLPKLSTRDLSGGTAKLSVIAFLSQCPLLVQKWCERILIKNLRAGVQESTINKIWPSLISTFDVQLASTLTTAVVADKFVITDKHEVEFPVRCESKFDGLRLITIKRDGVVKMYTRNGTELETLPKIREIIERCSYDNIVLDGEAMGDDWNESASIMMSRKDKKSDDNIKYYIFDALLLEEWDAKSCSRTQTERENALTAIVDTMKDSQEIVQSTSTVCNNVEELCEFYLDALDTGYEGVMVKDPNGLYEFDRTRAWRKVKPTTTYEGVVVETYESKIGTKREGTFAGFWIVLPNGIPTRVGSGFTDAQKEEINQDPEEWVGKIAEVEGQPPLTKEGKIRFPTFVRFREAADVDVKVITAGVDWFNSGKSCE